MAEITLAEKRARLREIGHPPSYGLDSKVIRNGRGGLDPEPGWKEGPGYDAWLERQRQRDLRNARTNASAPVERAVQSTPPGHEPSIGSDEWLRQMSALSGQPEEPGATALPQPNKDTFFPALPAERDEPDWSDLVRPQTNQKPDNDKLPEDLGDQFSRLSQEDLRYRDVAKKAMARMRGNRAAVPEPPPTNNELSGWRPHDGVSADFMAGFDERKEPEKSQGHDGSSEEEPDWLKEQADQRLSMPLQEPEEEDITPTDALGRVLPANSKDTILLDLKKGVAETSSEAWRRRWEKDFNEFLNIWKSGQVAEVSFMIERDTITHIGLIGDGGKEASIELRDFLKSFEGIEPYKNGLRVVSTGEIVDPTTSNEDIQKILSRFVILGLKLNPDFSVNKAEFGKDTYKERGLIMEKNRKLFEKIYDRR